MKYIKYKLDKLNLKLSNLDKKDSVQIIRK